MAKKKVGTAASAVVAQEEMGAKRMWSGILSLIRQKNLLPLVVSLTIRSPFVSKPLAAWNRLILMTSRGFLGNSRFRVRLLHSSGDPSEDLLFDVYSSGDLDMIVLDDRGQIMKEKKEGRDIPLKETILDRLVLAKYKVALYKNLLPLFQGVVSLFLASVSKDEEEVETALRVEVNLGPGSVFIPREINGATKASLTEILGKLPPCPGEAVNFVRVIPLKKRSAAPPRPAAEVKKE